MKIEYTLTEDDLVTHMQHQTFQTEKARKRRMVNRVLLPGMSLLFATKNFYEDQYIVCAVFLVFAIVYFVWSPAYMRRKYTKHYRAYVQKNYKNRIGQPEEADLLEDEIAVKFEGASSQVLYTALEKITELPCHVLLHLRAGNAFILPKRDFPDESATLAYIKDRAAAHRLPYADELDWVWK